MLRRWRLPCKWNSQLALIAVLSLVQGCFKHPADEVSRMVCKTDENCPLGYECQVEEEVCRRTAQLSGAHLDGRSDSQVEVGLGIVDAGSNGEIISIVSLDTQKSVDSQLSVMMDAAIASLDVTVGLDTSSPADRSNTQDLASDQPVVTPADQTNSGTEVRPPTDTSSQTGTETGTGGIKPQCSHDTECETGRRCSTSGVCVYKATAVTTSSNTTWVIANESLYGWGANSFGILGVPFDISASLIPSDAPVRIKSSGSGILSAVINLETGCVLTKEGAVKCFGKNAYGVLGGDTVTESYSPLQIPSLAAGVIDLSISPSSLYSTACAVTKTGSAYCWGNNECGQLGNNSLTNSNKPVQVTGLNSGVTSIAVGGCFACAIVNGSAMCWGTNGLGELGFMLGSTKQSLTPLQVPELTSGVTAITTGMRHACAIVNGVVHCWGSNIEGETGEEHWSALSERPTKLTTLGSGVTHIRAGSFYTCVIDYGAAKCWGQNNYGALGTGDEKKYNIPTQVVGLTSGVTEISTSNYRTCALVNGAVMCWGEVDAGKPSLVPKEIGNIGL
jgi:alpha-tubulin suppressor-like RCC1 family protein